MKSKSAFKIGGVFLMVLAVHLSSSPPAVSAGSRPKTDSEKASIAAMSPEELQSAVISYANRFISTIGQAAFQLETEIPTPQGRLVAASRKVYSLSAATEIAAGPNAGAALLDMVVMATLNRSVWEAYWRPQVFGAPATVMVDAFKKMETDAWALAAKVMTPEQRQEFRELIDDWIADNPGQIAVDYIRFSDFGGLGKKPNLKEIQKPGGLLEPVRQATAAVDEVRMTSERAMFMASKMQLIMGFQAELIYKTLVLQPEMSGIFKDVSGFRATADRMAAFAEQMPKLVADERSAALADVSKLIARERRAVLKAIDDKAATLHDINTDVQATLERVNTTFAGLSKTTSDVEILLEKTQQTAVVANDLVASVDRLMARLQSGKSAEPSKPFDINEYVTAIEKVQATLTALHQLVTSVDRPDAPLFTGLMSQLNKSAEARVDHIFRRLIQMLLVMGAIGFALLIVHFKLKQKITG